MLLQRQGWQVRGLFMKNWEEDDTANYCAAAQDLAMAQAVASHLGIELLTVNFATEYWERVFEKFLIEYRTGRTPNPDILCNSEIKFDAFLNYALGLGAEAIATGHYAQIKSLANTTIQLCLAIDDLKDQTYFLHRLNQDQLRLVNFPLSHLTKQQVRQIAIQANLPNAARKDSTGICFIGERSFQTFLAGYLSSKPGIIVTIDGEIIGEHQGLIHYTIGQRKGIKLGGVKGQPESAWYVVKKDIEKNILYVVPGHNHPALWNTSLDADNWHWISDQTPDTQSIYQARIRHRQPLQDCYIEPINSQVYRINFLNPQWAIAPGQAAVLYQNNVCLGGGFIQRAV